MILCAHGKLNVKHHRTNPKPEIHTSYHSNRERSCAGQNKEHKNVYKRPNSRARIYVCTQEGPISTNPESMEEAYEYGLTRGTCFVARRLEVVPVAGMMWIYFVVCLSFWCLVGFRIFISIFLLRTHTSCCKSEASSCFMYLCTSNEERTRERRDRGRFLPIGKNPLQTGVRTGFNYLIGLSGCVYV